MSNRLFDYYPAEIEPWPEEVPAGVRVRAIGYPDGLVALWDTGRSDGVERRDIIGRYQVGRGPGCGTCGARRLLSEKVTGLRMPEPPPVQEPEAVQEAVNPPQPKRRKAAASQEG